MDVGIAGLAFSINGLMVASPFACASQRTVSNSIRRIAHFCTTCSGDRSWDGAMVSLGLTSRAA